MRNTSTTQFNQELILVMNGKSNRGYFSAKETLAGLKPGTYEFIVTNKAGKLAGFQLQDENHKQLDMFPLEPGQTRTTRIDIDGGGFRYRCPINPTPWYKVDVADQR